MPREGPTSCLVVFTTSHVTLKPKAPECATSNRGDGWSECERGFLNVIYQQDPEDFTLDFTQLNENIDLLYTQGETPETWTYMKLENTAGLSGKCMCESVH